MNDLLNEYPPILNINEVAEILGVTPNTIRKLIKNNSIHAVKVGKRYKITKTKLLNFLGEYDEVQNKPAKEVAT
jgi:excisionase family DNA binding protein